MEGFAYFPSIIYRDEQPRFINEIFDVCLRNLNINQKQEPHLSQSIDLRQEPSFFNLIYYILESSKIILQSQGYLVDKYDFYLQGIWAQEIVGQNGTNVHTHKNSQISGWFFLETPLNGSYPIFYDSRSGKNMIELDFEQSNEITNATNAIHFNNVKPGTVLFNNSWLQHQLNNGISQKPTRCVHFIVSHKDKLCNT